MSERNLDGLLTFIGFVVATMAIVYFSVEYIPELHSHWAQVFALILMGVSFASFAAYVQYTTLAGPFFDVRGLRWLRPSSVLYLLTVVAGFFATLAFFAVDGLGTPVKVLVALVVGLGLLVLVARRRKTAAVKDA